MIKPLQLPSRSQMKERYFLPLDAQMRQMASGDWDIEVHDSRRRIIAWVQHSHPQIAQRRIRILLLQDAPAWTTLRRRFTREQLSTGIKTLYGAELLDPEKVVEVVKQLTTPVGRCGRSDHHVSHVWQTNPIYGAHTFRCPGVIRYQ